MASVRVNFNPDNFRARIRTAVKAKARDHLAAKLDGLRCEEHGKTPEIHNSAGDEVTFRSCCEALH